ncbi:NifB/NifX family molybdenum-iron cluster-binding protein [Crassaminicella profunda]|uniref:NifB/NifX family molybdenum-iron cluster-binding protein n=1 Tax=Crassaminicella profunda TaxID=1286698 RepID=UPI001CA678EF|nr:NifB/NifX family molybdenum-iron cluster-binding protein [Crassaminicella profunda]QZY55728.1 NifB/NifX family molybdenum-iron cluster-binding protein [Crassaminicella profunda]
MKICITSMGNEKDAMMDSRFGRCPYFAIYDTETKEYEFMENNGVTAPGGAGIAAGQQVVSKGAEVVITGFIGPNAKRVIEGGQIKVYNGKGGSIEAEIKLYEEGKLTMIENAAPAHSGMGK